MTTPRICLATILVAILATSGCEDARVARLASEAADRQAAQNVELARVAEQAVAGAKQLVAADADARRETIRVHAQLQDERRRLDEGWTALDAARRDHAHARGAATIFVLAAKSFGLVFVAALALGLAWLVLVRPAPGDAEATALVDLVTSETWPELADLAEPRPALTRQEPLP